MEENNTKRLLEVTGMEVAEFEKMADILSKKQSAISRLDTATVESIISEELTGLNRIRNLEKERAGILQALSLTGKELNNRDSLTKKLGSEYSAVFAEIHERFRGAWEKVRRLNEMCQVLLLHSLAFIKQNIRILTDDGKRKLVDKKA